MPLQLLDKKSNDCGQDISLPTFHQLNLKPKNRDLVKHADEFFNRSRKWLGSLLRTRSHSTAQFLRCRTPQQMRRFIRIILNAKNNLEKEHQALGVKINLGDDTLKPLITKTLRRYFNVLRSNEKHVKDI